MGISPSFFVDFSCIVVVVAVVVVAVDVVDVVAVAVVDVVAPGDGGVEGYDFPLHPDPHVEVKGSGQVHLRKAELFPASFDVYIRKGVAEQHEVGLEREEGNNIERRADPMKGWSHGEGRASWPPHGQLLWWWLWICYPARACLCEFPATGK